jgi:DNA-binding transcriptional LysR family regulator
MTLPDLESLACVDALARTLRFHAAAKSRFLSPAAFSKRIQQVEEHVGKPLFARTTRTVELTAAGASLLPRIRAVLAGADGLALSPDAAPVRITLGTRHELGISWLIPARRALQRAMPHVSIDLRFGSTDELERAVLALRVDAILTSHAPSTTKLDSLPLARESYAFVASPKALRRTPFRRAEDAARHTLVDAHDDLPLFSYLRATGLPLRFARVVTLGTIEAIKIAVLDGEGVAVLPRYFVEVELRRKTLTRLLPKARLGQDFFRLVYRSDDVHRDTLERVAQFLAKRPLG